MLPPFIQNVSRGMVAKGDHFFPGENSLLIQIADPLEEFPVPKHKFKMVRRFRFFDCDDENDPEYGEASITDEDALGIVIALRHALDNHMQVVVHCHAGVCRSGAVAEIGVLMGFTDGGGNSRIPNVLVKKKMMQVLGLSYDVNAELKARYEKLVDDKNRKYF